MANTVIKLKSSGVTGNVPNNLEPGELAINYVDGKLFYGNTSCNAILFDVNNPAGLEGELQFNNSGEFGSSANLKFDNTTKTLNVKNVFANGNVVTDTLTVIRTTNLGNVSNVTITGGSANQFLITDGLGNLSFGVGTMGAQGAAGAQGAVGAQGAQGAQGVVGAQGAQGVAGAQGVQGAVGQAAPWEVFTANTTAVSGQQLIANTYSGTFTITLPATPYIGNVVRITDGYDWSINNLVIARNGSTIEGTTSDVIVDVKGTTVEFVYDNVTWQVVSTIGPMGNTGPQGIQGTIGPQGFQGVAGAQGAVGAQGDVGAQGAQGAVGAQGVQGATGAQGAIGAQGVQGATGAQGAQGPQGSTPTIGGSDTHIQFNNSGSLDGTANLIWNGTSLGVGAVTNPTAKIHVTSSSLTDFNALILRNQNANVGATAVLGFEVSTGTAGNASSLAAQIKGIRTGAGTTGALAFWTTNAGTPAEAVRIVSDGHVGIGTTNPTWKLEVEGNQESLASFRPSSNTSAGYARFKNGGGTFYIGIESSDGTRISNSGLAYAASMTTEGNTALTFGTNNTNRMTLDANGKFGIGTTTPLDRLDVVSADGTFRNRIRNSGANEAVLLFQNSSTGTTGNDGLYLGIDGSMVAYLWNYESAAIAFGTSNTERARIDSSGNLVIGNTTAWSRLHASKTVNNTNTSANNITDYQGAAFILHNQDEAGTGNKAGMFFAFAGSPGLLAGMDGYKINGTWDTGLRWYTNNQTGGNVGTLYERMHLDASGNLGIGTSSPAARLSFGGYIPSNGQTVHVYQSSNVRSGLGVVSGVYRVFTDSGSVISFGQVSTSDGSTYTERARIDSSGKVGIGTTNPQTTLDIRSDTSGNATIDNGITLLNASAVNDTPIGIRMSTYGDATGNQYPKQFIGAIRDGAFGAGKGSIVFCNRNAADTSVVTMSDERARITYDGNLLVGTTSGVFGSERVAADAGSARVFVGKTTSSGSEVYSAWSSATSGDNRFAGFWTETAANERGSITYNRAGGLVAYNTTSDYRAKDISGPITNSGALIDSVPVYTGTMKGATQERPMFIAHETPNYAHTGEKDAVDADGKPVYQQMDASALIPVMWAEIQSLRKRLAAANL